MHLRFQSTLPRGEQLNMSKLPPPRTVPQQVSSCLQIDLRECFGTAPLPTSTSVASSRGKGVFWPVFVTAPLPTDVSVESSRGKGGLLTGLRHGDLTHKYFRAIPACRRGSSDRSSARQPCPQMSQWHPCVAKGSSGRSSARLPCPQVPQSHPRVAKGASDRSSARLPCPQALQWHPCVPALTPGDENRGRYGYGFGQKSLSCRRT